MSFLDFYGNGSKPKELSKPRFLFEAGQVAVDDLKREGKFCRTMGGELFYVGGTRVIPLESEDPRLRTLIMRKFCVSPASGEIFRHIVEACQLEAFEQGEQIEIHQFSHADPQTKTIYLSLLDGERMLKLTGDLDEHYDVTLPIVPQGTDGVFFADSPDWQPWKPTFLYLTDEDGDPLYDEKGTPIATVPEGYIRKYLVNPINFAETDLTVEESKWLFEKWVCTLPLDLREKPIIHFHGDPGAAKTSSLRFVLQTLLGKQARESQITKEDAYSAAIASDPFVILDNLDDSQPDWLPTALCTTATGATLTLRKLYSTNTAVKFQPRAAVAVTSTDSRYMDSRTALSDRTLSFKLVRRDDKEGFLAPEALEPEILKNRNYILTEIAARMNEYVYVWRNHKIEKSPLRIASFGIALARLSAYGEEQKAVETVIRKLKGEQRKLLDGNVAILALGEFFTANPDKDEWTGTAGQLADLAHHLIGTRIGANGMGQKISSVWTRLQEKFHATHDEGRTGAKLYTFHRPSVTEPKPASETQTVGAN